MFSFGDLKDNNSFSKAVVANSGVTLKTTESQNKEPKLSLTSYGLSEAMQGIGLYKPDGATYDVFNRELGKELEGLGAEALWTQRDDKLRPYDVFLDDVDPSTAGDIGGTAAAGSAMTTPGASGPVDPGAVLASGFSFPGEGGKEAWSITGHWGKDKGGHPGVDLIAKDGNTAGKKMLAVKAGQVHQWPNNKFSGAGNMIQINHGGGLWTMYMHMSELIAPDGATVQQGQPIGVVGSTGYSTGPHIHFEVHTGIPEGDFIRFSNQSSNQNPEPYIGF